mmetsp:Transcript_48673/g.105606  ORF Transcript_48673/g.105606 Transcript_48673/m.105606 type:complete len:206 (-) Transcript_48673:286-903(-)
MPRDNVGLADTRPTRIPCGMCGREGVGWSVCGRGASRLLPATLQSVTSRCSCREPSVLPTPHAHWRRRRQRQRRMWSERASLLVPAGAPRRRESRGEPESVRGGTMMPKAAQPPPTSSSASPNAPPPSQSVPWRHVAAGDAADPPRPTSFPAAMRTTVPLSQRAVKQLAPAAMPMRVSSSRSLLGLWGRDHRMRHGRVESRPPRP